MRSATAQVELSHGEILERLRCNGRDGCAWRALESGVIVPLVRRSLVANSRRSGWLADEIVARVSLKLLKRVDRVGVADIQSLGAFVATMVVRERNQLFRLEQRGRRAAAADRLERMVDELVTDQADRDTALAVMSNLVPALDEVISRGGKPAVIARAVKQLNESGDQPLVYPHWKEVCASIYGPPDTWEPGRQGTYREQWRRFHERFVHSVRRRIGEE